MRIGVLFISYLAPGLPLNPFANASLIFFGFILSITELYTILKWECKYVMSFCILLALLIEPNNEETLSVTNNIPYIKRI